jgi:hypothetical protein
VHFSAQLFSEDVLQGGDGAMGYPGLVFQPHSFLYIYIIIMDYIYIYIHVYVYWLEAYDDQWLSYVRSWASLRQRTLISTTCLIDFRCLEFCGQLPCVQQCFVSSLRDCGPTRYIGKYMEMSRDGLY